jgi:hypothetical protein
LVPSPLGRGPSRELFWEAPSINDCEHPNIDVAGINKLAQRLATWHSYLFALSQKICERRIKFRGSQAPI